LSVHHKGVSDTFKFEVTGQVVPPEATHCLRCGYHNLMGYTQQEIKTKVESTIVPVVNAILVPMGWVYCGVGVFGDYFEIYYRATPVEPVTMAICLKILFLITVIIIGIVIAWVAWVYLKTNEMKAQAKIDKKQLLEEGKITKEQYEALIKAQAEEDTWGSIAEMIKWALIAMIILAIIGALPKGRREED